VLLALDDDGGTSAMVQNRTTDNKMTLS